MQKVVRGKSWVLIGCQNPKPHKHMSKTRTCRPIVHCYHEMPRGPMMAFLPASEAFELGLARSLEPFCGSSGRSPFASADLRCLCRETADTFTLGS
jgi:hypothetical protein